MSNDLEQLWAKVDRLRAEIEELEKDNACAWELVNGCWNVLDEVQLSIVYARKSLNPLLDSVAPKLPKGVVELLRGEDLEDQEEPKEEPDADLIDLP